MEAEGQMTTKQSQGVYLKNGTVEKSLGRTIFGIST